MAPKNESKPAAKPKPAGTSLGEAVPSEAVPMQTSGDETTLFFDIDLKNGAPAMTAVHVPFKFASGALDLLVYLPGHKTADLDGVALSGMSVDKFLTLKTVDLRGMIRGTKKRQFALVVPTLGNTSQAGELVKSGAAFDQFLALVREGIGTFLPTAKSAPAPGNLILAAHSGGGDPLFSIARQSKVDSGTRARIREVWCFDCTYSHGADWLPMLPDYVGRDKNPLPGLVKLWVVSTGMNPASRAVRPDMKKPADPLTNPETVTKYDSGTGDNAHRILEYAQAAAKGGKAQTTTVSVYHAGLFHWDKAKNLKPADVNYTGYKAATSHYGVIGDNLPLLVTSSTVLK